MSLSDREITVTDNTGRTVKMTGGHFTTIHRLNETRRGGCATVEGYRPSTNWVERPVQNIQMITHFSVAKMYERKIMALSNLTFNKTLPNIMKDPKLAELPRNKLIELFELRKGKLIESMNKSLNGERDDSRRTAHDTCYAWFGDVKVHLKTEKVDGITQPVTDVDGHVILDTIMVPYLELSTETVKEGVRKTVNSGAPVRMQAAIEKSFENKSLVYKTLSLKEDNFDKLVVDRKRFLPEDVNTFGSDVLMVG